MTQKKDLKMKLLLSLAMTALLFFSQLILANDAIDWCCKIGVNGLLTCAEKTLPAPFFRHARWKEKVDHKGSDLPMQKKSLSDEEFQQTFKFIEKERALEIYYIIAITQMLFNKHHIKAMPIGGTMLGMLRNEGQLPYDDDADFALNKKDWDKVWALRNKLASSS